MNTFLNTFRCPYLDWLGHELIEAYRRVEDYELFCQCGGELFCQCGGVETPTEIASIHHAMADHRKSCLLCQEIAHAIEIADIAAFGRHLPGEASSPQKASAFQPGRIQSACGGRI